MEEEIKYTDDLEVETNVKESERPIDLDENNLQSSQAEEKKDKKEKQKNKKGLKKRIIAWALGLGVFAGGVAGVKAYKEYNTTGNGAYNKLIEANFEQANKSLSSQLRQTVGENKTIKSLKFQDENFLEVYYDGNSINPVSKKTDYYSCYAIYEYATEYYYQLINAEKENNMINYLEVLNNVFSTMSYINSEMYTKVNFVSNIENTEQNNKKLSKLFALDVEKENVNKQIGFLPYDIHIEKWDVDFDNKSVSYTYRLSGISYCETDSENSVKIESGEDLFLANSYDKKHIKTYYRDFTISGTNNYIHFIPFKHQLLSLELEAYLNGEKDLEVKTTYFEETNILDEFLNMRTTYNFNYKKPADLDLTNI